MTTVPRWTVMDIKKGGHGSLRARVLGLEPGTFIFYLFIVLTFTYRLYNGRYQHQQTTTSTRQNMIHYHHCNTQQGPRRNMTTDTMNEEYGARDL
jgi:hypothetical protein